MIDFALVFTGRLVSVFLLCIFLACLPVVAQVPSNLHVIDVHLHAMHPEEFDTAASFNFGAIRKTYRTNERDPEALLRRTIAEMDKNHVSKGVISGDDDVVAKWVERYPNRFLPSYSHWCDGKPETVAKFEAEWKAGKWRAIGELGLPYGGHPLNDPACFPLFEIAQRNEIPVFFHTGPGGPNPQEGFAPKFRISLSDPLLLEDVAIRFPKLKIVIMHMGWPFYDHVLYMLFNIPECVSGHRYSGLDSRQKVVQPHARGSRCYSGERQNSLWH